MKPLKLKLDNFGPYEEQTIDFESFEEIPLFLISGKTGSGKTTLFDAMCFALFGKTSGMDRQPEQMRSDFAKATEATSVKFEFEHHGKTYSIVRQPKQVLAKKRGKGMRESNAKIELTFKDNDGKEKVLTKMSVVNGFLKDLLHLTAEQFTQIILLPQGKFRRFLTANSNDKEGLLRELFGTFFYHQWSEDIQKRAKQIIQANEEQNQTIKVLQSQIQGFDNNGDVVQWLKDLNERVSDEARAVQKGSEDVRNQGETVEKMVSDYREKCQLHEDLIKITELKEQYESLKGQGKSINILRGKLLKLEWVEKNKDLFSSLEYSRKKSTDLEKMISDKKKALQQSKSRSIEKKNEQVLLQRESEKMNKLRVSVMEGKGQAELFKRAEVWRAKCTELASKLSEEKEKLETSQRKCISIEETLAKKEKKVEKRDVLNEETLLLQQETAKLAEEQGQLAALNKMHTEMIQKNSELLKFEKNLEKAYQEYQDAQKLYSQLDNDFALTQIQRLSQHLKTGTPCPVCGSMTHPAPAKVELVKDITESKVKEAQDNAKKAADIYHSYKGEYQAKKDQSGVEKDRYRKQYEKVTKLVVDSFKGEILTDLADLLEKKRDKILHRKQKLEVEQVEIGEATREIKILQNKKQKLQKIVEQTKDNIHEITVAHAKVKTTIKRLIEQLPTNFKTLAELQSSLKKQQTEVTEYDVRVRELQEEVEHTALSVTALETNIQNYRQQFRDEEKVKNQLSSKVQFSVQNCDFAVDSDFIEKSLRELSKAANYRDEIKDYEEKLITIKTKTEQLTERTKNLKDPKLEELKNKLLIEKEKRDALVDTVAKYKQTYQGDKSIFEQVSSLWNSQQKKLKKLASWNQLAEVMNGKGRLKLSLERYVLRSYLSKVLLIANGHLARLSQGRYAFKLDKNNGAYATDTGLEINVFDDNTGKVRSVHTLSGGESFIAALALSLALGEVLQNVNGGSNIEALFIDEGFGSLDEEALETALEALQTIEGANRLFGIISHVGILRDKIPDQMRVLSNNGHSTIVYEHKF